MIAVFTSNEKGGILQMAIKILEVLLELDNEVKCFMPVGAEVTIPNDLKDKIKWYYKAKTPNPYNSAAKSLSKDILSLSPSFVWYIDNGTFSSQVGFLLAGKVKQGIVMHDAGTVHSTFNTSLRQKLKLFIEKKTSELFNNKIDYIITCSPSGKNTYCSLYPKHKNKTLMLPLGPHMPEGRGVCPIELKDEKDYIMFFGRIDKYKGIDILLRTFRKWDGGTKLVIAGGGTLQEYEQKMALNEKRLVLINRFIKDEEMPYLFRHAKAVVLPYKDATQSGVLPIAYLYSIPVICSNVIGIAQFVVDGETGYVCMTDDDYIKAFSYVTQDDIIKKLKHSCYKYYENNLAWKNNIVRMLNYIGIL